MKCYKYVALTPGDIIRAGDEYHWDQKIWKKFPSLYVGKPFEISWYPGRRPVTKLKVG